MLIFLVKSNPFILKIDEVSLNSEWASNYRICSAWKLHGCWREIACYLLRTKSSCISERDTHLKVESHNFFTTTRPPFIHSLGLIGFQCVSIIHFEYGLLERWNISAVKGGKGDWLSNLKRRCGWVGIIVTYMWIKSVFLIFNLSYNSITDSKAISFYVKP